MTLHVVARRGGVVSKRKEDNGKDPKHTPSGRYASTEEAKTGVCELQVDVKSWES